MRKLLTAEVAMRKLLTAIGGAILTALGAMGLRRRRKAASDRRGDGGGGGLAGVREPRNPLPTTLSDAGVGPRTD